jgi:hypothetical protein
LADFLGDLGFDELIVDRMADAAIAAAAQGKACCQGGSHQQ